MGASVRWQPHSITITGAQGLSALWGIYFQVAGICSGWCMSRWIISGDLPSARSLMHHSPYCTWPLLPCHALPGAHHS